MGKDGECCSGGEHECCGGENGCCCDDFDFAQVGKKAPCFKVDALVGGEFKEVSLCDYKGKWVLLYFYPLDFTFVCPTEIAAINEKVPEFEKLNCQVLAASTDSVYSHLAWTESNPLLKNIAHPMLADTAHTLSLSYGVLVEDKGIALRGAFLIDPEGTLQWININGLDIGRSVEEMLRVLQACQSGGLTPCNWQPGDANL